MLILLEL